METTITLAEVKAKLQGDGYSGLYYPGECACCVDDLAPCGSVECDGEEDYINNCEGGYKHVDPTRPDFWVISANKEPPSQGLFDELHATSG